VRIAQVLPEVAMTSLPNRTRTALLVIDMQTDVIANAFDRDRVVANIQTLVDEARSSDVPVLWVQHSDEQLVKGSEGWQYVPELERRESEPLIHKTYGDSFEETELGDLLSDLGVGHLVVTGAQTEACIRSTLHGGLVRGYDVTLVSDAHTTEDMRQWGFPVTPEESIAYTNMYWSWAAPRPRDTVTSRRHRLLGAAGKVP
jgi:nicotinamidase-related amidase